MCLKGAGNGLLVCCLHKLYLDVVCAGGVEPVDLLSTGIIVCVQVHVLACGADLEAHSGGHHVPAPHIPLQLVFVALMRVQACPPAFISYSGCIPPVFDRLGRCVATNRLRAHIATKFCGSDVLCVLCRLLAGGVQHDDTPQLVDSAAAVLFIQAAALLGIAGLRACLYSNY